MENSTDSQILYQPTQPTSARARLKQLKLILVSIWNPTREEHLTTDEFDVEHQRFIPQVATVWKVKMLVIAFNLFTCLLFTINFRKASFFLTALLSISVPWIDKYTWLRFIVNGFLTNEPKYFHLFFATFGVHILTFIAWTAGLLWNSVGWYLLLIDPKNYGLLLSFLIVFNSTLLSVYVILICMLYVKLIRHVRAMHQQAHDLANTNEFQRLLPNEETNGGYNEV